MRDKTMATGRNTIYTYQTLKYSKNNRNIHEQTLIPNKKMKYQILQKGHK